jgi:hypothetical protein
MGTILSIAGISVFFILLFCLGFFYIKSEIKKDNKKKLNADDLSKFWKSDLINHLNDDVASESPYDAKYFKSKKSLNNYRDFSDGMFI